MTLAMKYEISIWLYYDYYPLVVFVGFINATLGGVTWRRWGMLVGSRAFGGKPDVNEQNNMTCVFVGLPVLFPTLLLLLCPQNKLIVVVWQ